MRLRAGLCGLMPLLLAACETIPEIVKIEIDERVIEVKRKPLPADKPPPPALPDAHAGR